MTEVATETAPAKKTRAPRAPKVQPKKFMIVDSTTGRLVIDLTVGEVAGFLSANATLSVYPFDLKVRDYSLVASNKVNDKFKPKTEMTYEE